MEFTFTPIGYIKSTYKEKYDAPRQPNVEKVTSGKIVLEQHQNYETALHDLDGFTHIWVIYVFHKNSNWKPKVLPPRNIREKKGLFATRSPYRPNQIGMSVVKLKQIKGRTLFIEDHDLLDGTPILDIKPYLNYSDSHPDASLGWIAELDEKTYTISYENGSLERITWLETNRIFFREELEKRLSYDPFPHPYRRITKQGDQYQIDFKEWSASFSLIGLSVRITDVFSGFSSEKISIQEETSLHKQFIKSFIQK